MSKPVVINLMGGPGVGKSVLAADIYSVMKKAGAKVEMAPEWIKAPVYEGRINVIEDQLYVLGKQHRNISRLVDHVDYVVCDSPVLLCPIYAKENYYPNFKALAFDVFEQYQNIVMLVERPETWAYQTEGRYQDAEGAKAIDQKIENFLLDHDIRYVTVNPAKDIVDMNFIRHFILSHLFAAV